jgi:hypothetical protein
MYIFTVSQAGRTNGRHVETNMENWIDRLLMGCGGVAGLLLGTGHAAEGAAIAAVAIPVVWLMRMQARAASEEM